MQDQTSFCDLLPEEVKKMSPQFISANVEFIPFLEQVVAGYPPAALKTRWRIMKAGPFKGVRACLCCMLQGSLMHKVRCRIYDSRPSTCKKAVKPGDRSCVQIRRMFLGAIERMKEEEE